MIAQLVSIDPVHVNVAQHFQLIELDLRLAEVERASLQERLFQQTGRQVDFLLARLVDNHQSALLRSSSPLVRLVEVLAAGRRDQHQHHQQQESGCTFHLIQIGQLLERRRREGGDVKRRQKEEEERADTTTSRHFSANECFTALSLSLSRSLEQQLTSLCDIDRWLPSSKELETTTPTTKRED